MVSKAFSKKNEWMSDREDKYMSKKVINSKEKVVDELLEGFVGAYNKQLKKHPKVNGVINRNSRKDKVALVIGGGSGHEPMFAGFVGQGLADASACGNIFASPDPNTIYETAKAVDQGKGVLFVYGCYAGDNLNFDMGEEFLNDDGIKTAHVRVQDDVASAPIERMEDRRGIAGDVFVMKVAGAACDAGLELEEVVKVTEKARDNTRSIGIALSSAQLPGADNPIFELGEDEIEFGMGLHGEKGVLRTNMMSADVMVDKMYQHIIDDGAFKVGDEVCVYINSLGSTSIAELAIVFRRVKQLLEKDGIKIHDADLNSYCTSQEMGGFSITFMQLDSELKTYYDMPCYTPYYAKGSYNLTENDMGEETEGEVVEAPEFDVEDIEKAEIVRSQEGVLETLDVEDTRNMLLYIADKIIGQIDYLTQIDSEIGDGDHGIGMAGGMQKVKRKIGEMKAEKNVYALFEAAGKAMLLSMGGASGVIFGSLYLAGAKGAIPADRLDASNLATMERKSLEEIQMRGKAAVGDKTMVDALSPAVEALEQNRHKGLLEMLKEAELAAKQGVENTKEYQAKFGRAKSLMARAIGYQDAGATSVYLIFQGMREFVEGDIYGQN